MSRESYVKKSDLQDILDGIAEKIPKAQVTLQAEKTTLWSGEQTATGTLTLSDSVDNYDEIEMYMLGHSRSVLSFVNTYPISPETVLEYVNSSGNMCFARVSFSTTTCTVEAVGNLNSGTTYLGKIVGVKYSEETIFPDATSTVKGKTKLYNTKGNNTDGAITQKAVKDNYVDIDGNTPMTNDLTIAKSTGSPHVKLKDTRLTKGTTPSSNSYMYVAMGDNTSTDNANRFGVVEVDVKTDGSVVSLLSAYKNEANSTTNAQVSVTYPATGYPYASAPNSETGIHETIFTKGGGTLDGDLNLRCNSPHIFLKTTGVVKGTTPDVDRYSYLTFNEDSNALNGRLGMIQNKVNGTTGSVETQMFAFTPTAGSTDAGAILVRANTDGTFETSCPNADSTGSAKIMTKAGGTFTGNVTLSKSRPYVALKDSSTKGVLPDSTRTWALTFDDSSDDYGGTHRYGSLQTDVLADGETRVSLVAFRNVTGSAANTQIGLRITTDGTVTTVAPNPSTNSNTNEIATTKWVRDTIAPVTEGNATRNTTNTTAGTCFWQKNGKVVTLSINDVVVNGTGTAITIFTALPTVAGSKQYHFPMVDRDGNSYLAFVSGTGINIRVNTATAQGLFGSVSYMTT